MNSLCNNFSLTIGEKGVVDSEEDDMPIGIAGITNANRGDFSVLRRRFRKCFAVKEIHILCHGK